MKKMLKGILICLLCLHGCASSEHSASSSSSEVTVHISARMLSSLNTDARTYVSSLSDKDRKLFTSIQTGKDGSVTLIMSPRANRTWRQEYADTIAQTVSQYENSSAYSIAHIAYNSDYTTLKITETGEKAPMKDALLVLPLAVYGEMYQLMAGVQEKDIRIHCVIRSASGIQIDDVTYPDDLPAEKEDHS